MMRNGKRTLPISKAVQALWVTCCATSCHIHDPCHHVDFVYLLQPLCIKCSHHPELPHLLCINSFWLFLCSLWGFVDLFDGAAWCCLSTTLALLCCGWALLLGSSSSKVLMSTWPAPGTHQAFLQLEWGCTCAQTVPASCPLLHPACGSIVPRVASPVPQAEQPLMSLNAHVDASLLGFLIRYRIPVCLYKLSVLLPSPSAWNCNPHQTSLRSISSVILGQNVSFSSALFSQWSFTLVFHLYQSSQLCM